MTHDPLHNVLTEAAAQAAPHVGAVAKSRYELPDLGVAAGVAVIAGDRPRISRDQDVPGLALTLTVLRAVDEKAADMADEIAARQAEAEAAFWAIRDAWESELKSPVAVSPKPWRYAYRSGDVTIYTARPDMRTFCVAVSAQFAFRVNHLQPTV